MSLFTIGIVIASLIVGFGSKLYFGSVRGEKTQDMIEKIIETQTGINLEPLFDLDNDDEQE